MTEIAQSSRCCSWGVQLGVTGILVLEAREGGPAWKAGVRGTKRDTYGRLVYGDIITSFNGAKVKNMSDPLQKAGQVYYWRGS